MVGRSRDGSDGHRRGPGCMGPGRPPRELPWRAATSRLGNVRRPGSGLLLWEAFVSAGAKGATHVDDAAIAVAAFVKALPDPRTASHITAERPLSLAGGVALWSGWRTEPSVLHELPLVIRAQPQCRL
jgi:hypothetical protein